MTPDRLIHDMAEAGARFEIVEGGAPRWCWRPYDESMRMRIRRHLVESGLRGCDSEIIAAIKRLHKAGGAA